MHVPVPGARGRRALTTLAWLLVPAAVFGWYLLVMSAGAFRSGRLVGGLVVAAVALGIVLLFVVVPLRSGGGLASPMVQATARARPVPVPERVPSGPVRACLQCGSLDVTMPGIRDGVWIMGGQLQFLVCRNCNARSPGLEFDTGEDYVAFVRSLHETEEGP